MGDWNFLDGKTMLSRLRKNLGVDERAHRGQLHRVEYAAPEQLERTINVPYFYTQRHADQRVPGPGIQQPMRRIGARFPISSDNVIFSDPWN